ncbi:MAG: hypothetical protein ACE5KU_00700 [Nitrososphaerales archaeon]
MGYGVGRPERELSVGEMVSAVFSLYSSRFLEFVTPFVLAGLVSGMISSVTFSFFPLDFMAHRPVGADVISWMLSNLGTLILTILFLGLVSWVIYTIVGGLAVKFASDLIEYGEADYRVGFNEVISRLPSLLGAGLITAVLIGLGLILFILPGVILAIIFSLVVPVIMIERLSAFRSLSRSRLLVRNRWGKTFALLLIVAVIIVLADLIAGSIVASVTQPPVSSIFTALVSSILQPLYFISTTILYYSMIVREPPEA